MTKNSTPATPADTDALLDALRELNQATPLTKLEKATGFAASVVVVMRRLENRIAAIEEQINGSK